MGDYSKGGAAAEIGATPEACYGERPLWGRKRGASAAAAKTETVRERTSQG